jgi:hypothetical protein
MFLLSLQPRSGAENERKASKELLIDIASVKMNECDKN